MGPASMQPAPGRSASRAEKKRLPRCLFLALALCLAGCQARQQQPASGAPAGGGARPGPSQVRQGSGPLPTHLEFAFAPEIRDRIEGPRWLLRVELSPLEPQDRKPLPSGDNARFLGPEGASAFFQLQLAPVRQTLYFTQGVTGFLPDKLILDLASAGVARVELEPKGLASPASPAEMRPIPADPGTILLYRSQQWRRTEYELYSWNLFPKILVFDFADYDIQARFFRRLGFFQAVKGESGRVEEEEYYRGRHVYNAHAYGPEDLVQFFELARSARVRLNPQEELLKELALRNGILRMRGERLEPGEGAVASISRATPEPRVRKALLVHELAHALFFSVAAFREGCFRVWAELSEKERDFWRLFLENKGRLDRRKGYDGYDVANEYVTVNEFQAHVIQVEKAELQSHFRGWYAPRLAELVPEKRRFIESLIAADPAMFERTHSRLAEVLSGATGLEPASICTVSERR